ncbi:hypothetical protein MPER_12573 [Moniliophthora perniciosa FA553]|nr:hypothetical protein MPER_12573 [Moniliophthora perniciosa FA553]
MALIVEIRYLVFPNVSDLEIPADIISYDVPAHAVPFPNVRKMRLAVLDSCRTPEIISNQNYRHMTKLTHLMLSFWNVPADLVLNATHSISVPPSVRVVGVELDRGFRLPGNITSFQSTVGRAWLSLMMSPEGIDSLYNEWYSHVTVGLYTEEKWLEKALDKMLTIINAEGIDDMWESLISQNDQKIRFILDLIRRGIINAN